MQCLSIVFGLTVAPISYLSQRFVFELLLVLKESVQAFGLHDDLRLV